MEWRNEQIYHLRQSSLLIIEDQKSYFENVVAHLFDKEKPSQILFSYLKDGECIGYGGLVHINWIDKNAEISFIMKTELEQKEFKEHWGNYLELLEQVAFNELKFHKIFTYALDLRPHLYEAIEYKGFKKEAVLKEHCFFEGSYKDVVIHSKINELIIIREIEERDKQKTFEWANDPVTRQNSFNSDPILFEQHSIWYDSKLNDNTAHYFVCEVDSKPAGLVRFDFNEDEQLFIVGITIDENYRGRKLAADFLSKTCCKFKRIASNPIMAYIKEDNIASIRSFEKAGFKLRSIVNVSGKKSLKYEYER